MRADGQSFVGSSYLWLLPGHSFEVSAVVNSAFVISDAYGGIAGYMHSCCGLTSYHFFYFNAVATALSTIVIWLLVPTLPELTEIRRALAPTQRSSTQGLPVAADDPVPETKTGPSSTNCHRECAMLQDMATLCFRTDAIGWGGLALFVHVAALYMQQTVFSLQQFECAPLQSSNVSDPADAIHRIDPQSLTAHPPVLAAVSRTARLREFVRAVDIHAGGRRSWPAVRSHLTPRCAVGMAAFVAACSAYRLGRLADPGRSPRAPSVLLTRIDGGREAHQSIRSGICNRRGSG